MALWLLEFPEQQIKEEKINALRTPLGCIREIWSGKCDSDAADLTRRRPTLSITASILLIVSPQNALHRSPAISLAYK
jgi:hypothetical protein